MEVVEVMVPSPNGNIVTPRTGRREQSTSNPISENNCQPNEGLIPLFKQLTSVVSKVSCSLDAIRVSQEKLTKEVSIMASCGIYVLTFLFVIKLALLNDIHFSAKKDII